MTQFFMWSYTNATLTCYSQKDSTEIYNVSGTYYPELQKFRGRKGIVTWEKAGFQSKDVFAELTDYTINTSKNSFTVDSAKLTNNTYFKEPELGHLQIRHTSFRNKEKANFPRFTTYTKEFSLKIFLKG